ncbi:MAG: hypothetical protein ABSG54_10950 [Terriglobia bacterium]|jgi:hypothetical protein
MKCKQIGLCLLGTALFLAATAWGQQAANQGASLGDLAKQERTRRMKVMQDRSVRTWSNDNMPKRPPSEGLTAAEGMSTAPPPAASGSSPAGSTPPETASSGDTAGGPETHDEAYYRKKAGELRSRLGLHQRELSVLQQKQGQNEMQYSSDPNKTLQQEYSRSDINKANDSIAKKQQEIMDDQRAIQELESQLGREGHPPGWLR